MFYRTIEQELTNWARSRKFQPLVVRGARQIGKTTVIENFGKREFKNLVTINFEIDSSFARTFEADLKAKRIVADLEVRSGQPIIPGETLLFFDEVQVCPRAIQALRYFYEQIPDLHVIATGSLLEFALEPGAFPVGRVSHLFMYPFSFDEFLLATDRKKLVQSRPFLRSESNKKIAFVGQASQAITDELYKSLRQYWIVGGMPRAVQAWVESASYIKVAQVQDDLILSFLSDMPKYAKGDKRLQNLERVFRRVGRYLGQQITYSTLGEADNGQRTAESLTMLEKAMLCHRVYSVSPSALPLGGGIQEKHFKSLLLDIGLVVRMVGASASDILEQSALLDVFEGRLAEQFVGQELLANSFQASESGKLYCWIRAQKSSSAEVDYLIVRDGQIVPIEVKSAEGGRLKSLKILMTEYKRLKQALCLKIVPDIVEKEGVFHAPLFVRI